MKCRVFGSIMAVALVMSGCATTAGYEKLLNEWLGKEESSLVSSWGPPQGLYVSPDGHRILTYVDERTLVIPGYTAPSTTYVTGQSFGNTFSGIATTYNYSVPPSAMQFRCQTNFTIREGRVVSWSYKGNRCRA